MEKYRTACENIKSNKNCGQGGAEIECLKAALARVYLVRLTEISFGCRADVIECWTPVRVLPLLLFHQYRHQFFALTPEVECTPYAFGGDTTLSLDHQSLQDLLSHFGLQPQ